MAFEAPRNGDIRATLALSQAEAQTGSSRTLNLPGGRQINVPVRAGIRNGEEIRLRGQGEPLWNGGPSGDLILTVAIALGEQVGNQPSYYGSGPASPTAFTQAPSFQQMPTSSPNYPYPYPSTPPAGPTISQPPSYPYPPPEPTISSSPNYAATGPSANFPNYAAPGQVPQPLFPGQIGTSYADQGRDQSGPYSGFQQAGQQVPPAYVPPPERKRRGISAAIVILIVIVLLLLIGGSVFIYYTGVYQPQIRAQATATAQNQLTGTAQSQLSGTAQANAQATAQALSTAGAEANATATVVASATAAASATATALQNLYSQDTSGNPVLSDPLSAQDPNANWDEFSTNSTGGSCAFTGGAYLSSMTQKGFFQPCYAEDLTFDNFAFQVKMTITAGDEGGIIFRANNTNSKFYLFRISQSGAYDLYLYVDTQGTHAQLLLSGSSALINTGTNQPNTITVIATGGNLYFYINQKYLKSISSSNYTSGKIGVFGESDTNATDVAFSNLQVWKL